MVSAGQTIRLLSSKLYLWFLVLVWWRCARRSTIDISKTPHYWCLGYILSPYCCSRCRFCFTRFVASVRGLLLGAWPLNQLNWWSSSWLFCWPNIFLNATPISIISDTSSCRVYISVYLRLLHWSSPIWVRRLLFRWFGWGCCWQQAWAVGTSLRCVLLDWFYRAWVGCLCSSHTKKSACCLFWIRRMIHGGVATIWFNQKSQLVMVMCLAMVGAKGLRHAMAFYLSHTMILSLLLPLTSLGCLAFLRFWVSWYLLFQGWCISDSGRSLILRNCFHWGWWYLWRPTSSSVRR